MKRKTVLLLTNLFTAIIGLLCVERNSVEHTAFGFFSVVHKLHLNCV